MSIRRSLTMLACLALLGLPTLARAQTWSPEQQELWKVEQAQWKAFAEKDHSWIEKMVHPNVSLWETGEPAPQDRASLARWVRYQSAGSTVLEHELFPISATITGNVAVMQYRYKVAAEDLKKERHTTTGHYTDVLIKEGGRWLFLGWAGGDDPKK